jgi:hypothetical protein
MQLSWQARAQEEFIEQARLLTKFNFVPLYGGVILMQGKLAPYQDTLNFIFDTGSGGISLDSLTCEYFKIIPTPSNRTIRGIAGIKKVSFVHNMTLQLPGLEVDNLNFHINDYDILTSIYGLKIDGIIGYSVISRYIIKIDYDHSTMEFWTKGAMKYPRGGHMLKPQIHMLPVQSMRVKDDLTIYAKFLYDMGAGLNLMLSTDFIKDSLLLFKKKKFFCEGSRRNGRKDRHEHDRD